MWYENFVSMKKLYIKNYAVKEKITDINLNDWSKENKNSLFYKNFFPYYEWLNIKAWDVKY